MDRRLIEVRCFDADAIAPGLELLSDDERARAARFRDPRERDRWIVAHAELRRVLSAQTGIPAGELSFDTDGKPRLRNAASLYFNLSHSGSQVAIAVARHEIGIDVEFVNPAFDWQEVAPRVFAADQLQSIESLPAAQQREAFYRCWARTEALLKCTGEGVAPLPVSRERREEFWFVDLTPAPGYVGAIAGGERPTSAVVEAAALRRAPTPEIR